MTRQKSDKGIVPQGRVTPAPTDAVEPARGGKALAVREEDGQWTLALATADNPRKRGAAGKRSAVATARNRQAAPKARTKPQPGRPATMEEIVRNLASAFERVARNKGSAGPDGQSIAYVREHLGTLLPRLTHALENGNYQPGHARRAWIPKPGGGRRGLNIPNVVDRMVQEAVRQALEPVFEPTFHPQSHGFRPGRSCHSALAQAQEYVEEGYETVVDIDLEKFFDQVNHQRLMARLATRVKDRAILKLIARMLKAGVVMEDGAVIRHEDGLPQGGPLSPLLSNIVLDELDWELERRGHRFVRYADDCNIYVRSERAGRRVMDSISRFISRRLRLNVNLGKSAVGRPHERHFLGFTLWKKEPGNVAIGLSERTRRRLATRVRELTPRNWGASLTACIERVNRYLRGWWAFFGRCGGPAWAVLKDTDAHIRRRLRAMLLKQWKRKRTRARRLIALGAPPKATTRAIYGARRSLWELSRTYAVQSRALNNRFFESAGLESLARMYRAKLDAIAAPEPAQQALPGMI